MDKKPMITQLSNTRTSNYLALKNYILNNEDFQWSWLAETTPDREENGYDNFGFYVHSFLDRPDIINGCYSRIASPLIVDAHNVVIEILIANNISPKVIYRMSANCVHPTATGRYSVPHVDHEFPHKNLLIYLTDPQGGETVVEEEKYLGKEDDVIIWEEGMHYHRPPSAGRRVVLITTFL
jgi:hypothetical protein